MSISTLCRGSFIAVACWAASSAWAAAPETLDAELPPASAVTPVLVYELDTEMVVKDWVLCISAAVAEQLVQAREESVEKALSAYAGPAAGALMRQGSGTARDPAGKSTPPRRNRATTRAPTAPWLTFPTIGLPPMSSMAGCPRSSIFPASGLAENRGEICPESGSPGVFL